MATKKRPTHEIRFGAIRATIWANENRDGSRWYSVTLGRLYKDNSGQWQIAQHFKMRNMPDVARAAATAQDWMEQHTVLPEAKTQLQETVQQANDRGSKPGGRNL